MVIVLLTLTTGCDHGYLDELKKLGQRMWDDSSSGGTPASVGDEIDRPSARDRASAGSPAYARNGGGASYGYSCVRYLDEYSRVTLEGESAYSGSHKSLEGFRFIVGYISAYNVHVLQRKGNILGSMSINDAFRWMASWCRDDPSGRTDQGMERLILTLEKE